MILCCFFFFFFFQAEDGIRDLTVTGVQTCALPISQACWGCSCTSASRSVWPPCTTRSRSAFPCWRSEEHTSELQSQSNLVCRLLLEKKKANPTPHPRPTRHPPPPSPPRPPPPAAPP